MRLKIKLPAGATGKIKLPPGEYVVGDCLEIGSVRVVGSRDGVIAAALRALKDDVNNLFVLDFFKKKIAAVSTGIKHFTATRYERPFFCALWLNKNRCGSFFRFFNHSHFHFCHCAFPSDQSPTGADTDPRCREKQEAS